MGISKEWFLAGPEVDEAICPICLDVLEEPRRLSECDHHFCKNCIEEWQNTETTCPTCRTNGLIRNADPSMLAYIRTLPVKCPYKYMGCQILPLFCNINNHTENCGYRPVSCLRNCGEILAISNMAAHTLSCPNRVDHLAASIMCYMCNYEYRNGGTPTHCDYTELEARLRQNGYF